MLKIDKIDDENIRIRHDSIIDATVAPIFFASAGTGGMVTISPKVTGAYKSFSDLLENLEINGVSGSEFTSETAVQELNSFVGNFKKGGASSGNNGAYITVLTPDDILMQIRMWIGMEDQLPADTDRLGTKILYIALEN